ncbi:MAG TPA: GTPase HflX, partial [Elusimicrobiota bacterium]|nr:GTPase HflX [Elusimicrobiota bacterium]
FEQQTGGARGGIGTRGPGERKLEVDQRHIRERIRRIKREIEHVRLQRDLQRQNRRRIPLPQVALVGYTNVGKSTLLNFLTRSDGIYADDKLFATLDPTARRVKLPGGRAALFVDTVGFIQKLPHHLVAAFHATLEELNNADLLVCVVDAADPAWTAHLRVVQEVVKSLRADHLPQIVVFNKADLLKNTDRAARQREGRLLLSAVTGEGMDAFLSAVESRLDRPLLEKEFVLPYRRRDLLSVIYHTGRILSETPAVRGTRLRVRIDAQNWGHIQKELRPDAKPARTAS